MLLRTVKQINVETVARINRDQAKLHFLFHLRDAAFLREDLAAKNLQEMEKGHYYLKTLIHSNIGPLLTPEYGLVRSSIGNISYFQSLGASSIEEAYFTIRLIRNNEDPAKVELAIFVTTPEHPWKEFTLNPFHCGDAEGNGNILAVAAYFYNKRAMYEKTLTILLEKKSELEAALGEAYTADLLALFSALKSKKKLENFVIPKKNLSKEVLPYNRNDAKDLFRKKCKVIDFATLPFYAAASNEDIEAHLYLGPANTLVLDASYLGTASSVGEPRAVSNTDAKFTKFADEQLNDWLKNLEQLNNFGLAIYEGLKPKILISTI